MGWYWLVENWLIYQKLDWSKKLFSTFIKMFQINSVKLNKHYLTCLLLLLSLSIFYKCDQSFFWWIGFRSINVLSIEPSPPLSVVIRASRGPRKKIEKKKKKWNKFLYPIKLINFQGFSNIYVNIECFKTSTIWETLFMRYLSKTMIWSIFNWQGKSF